LEERFDLNFVYRCDDGLELVFDQGKKGKGREGTRGGWEEKAE
jgi:hypothetical protein